MTLFLNLHDRFQVDSLMFRMEPTMNWRFAIAWILAWSLSGSAAATDAPPTLAELLKEYRALGLPLPPEKAKLVRFRFSESETVDGKLKPAKYRLQFEMKPGTKTENPILFSESLEEWQPQRAYWDIVRTEDTKGDSGAIKDLYIGRDEELLLAIQCHARGWNELADDLLNLALKIDPKSPLPTPKTRLAQLAWRYWESQAIHPTADRAPVAKRLKELIKNNAELDKKDNRELLNSLELALVPSKAKPGTIEAMIDRLVDYTVDVSTAEEHELGDLCWSIIERGFDAIPALIAYLKDDRLTRSTRGWWSKQRVRDVVFHILDGLAVGEVGPYRQDATDWWDKVRQGKEETYLMEHVIPPDPKVDEQVWINPFLVRVQSAKYPKQIPVLYRTVLDKRPELGGFQLAPALLRTPGPKKEKLDLLIAAAEHKDNSQREPAYSAIAKLDKRLFEKMLLATIENIPKQKNNWNDVYLSSLIVEADDPKLWVALEKAAKSASVAVRVELIVVFSFQRTSSRHTEHVRLLAAFLDDEAVQDNNGPFGLTGTSTGGEEVRNIAAQGLAYLLGVEINKDKDKLRKAVRDELKATLDKPK